MAPYDFEPFPRRVRRSESLRNSSSSMIRIVIGRFQLFVPAGLTSFFLIGGMRGKLNLSEGRRGVMGAFSMSLKDRDEE
jgi:hypothetical protein